MGSGPLVERGSGRFDPAASDNLSDMDVHDALARVGVRVPDVLLPRPGTDLNIAGSNGTIRSGLGTGNAAGSSLIFQTPDPIASSTVAQTYGQRLSLSALGATFDIPDQSFRINGQVSGAGASAGTLTNAPAAGNPSFWLPINVGGTVYFFPGL